MFSRRHAAKRRRCGRHPVLSAKPHLETLERRVLPANVSVSALPSTSEYAQGVALSVTVTPTGTESGPPSGTVTFTENGFEGTFLLGTVTVSNGQAQFKIPSTRNVNGVDTVTLPAGVNTITASYKGGFIPTLL